MRQTLLVGNHRPVPIDVPNLPPDIKTIGVRSTALPHVIVVRLRNNEVSEQRASRRADQTKARRISIDDIVR